MSGTGRTVSRIGPTGLLCFAMALVFALWAGKVSWSSNLGHVCQSKQWPALEACSRSAQSMRADPAGAEWALLRQRVASNPGDGVALAEMARYAGVPAVVIGMEGSALLREAAKLAPQRTEVLQQQAVRSLAKQDWDQAVASLIRLSVWHADQEASRALGRLMDLSSRDARLLQVLRVAVGDGSGWGERAVAAMRAEKQSFSSALPLLSEMIVSGAIKSSTGLVVVRSLKSEGRWLDAHAVWLQLWKRPLDLIHNGDFERDFVPNAFDWDFADGRSSSLGAHIDRIGAKDRGEVLRIQFTGQAVSAPVLKHDLFVPAGTYRLDSEVRLSDLRGAGGFVWAVTCIDGGKQLARSEPLISQDRQWASLTFVLEVPLACQACTLALVPGSSVEARSGATGEMLLDHVRLTCLDRADQMVAR